MHNRSLQKAVLKTGSRVFARDDKNKTVSGVLIFHAESSTHAAGHQVRAKPSRWAMSLTKMRTWAIGSLRANSLFM